MVDIINFRRGDSGTISAQINDANGAGYDLSAVDKATLSVRSSVTAATYQFQVSGNLPGGATGLITFTMLPRYTGYLTVDSNGNPASITGLTLSDAAGTLTTGTYYYRVSATNWRGETLACTEVSHAITGPAGVKLDWDAIAGASSYKIYGRSTGAELLMATVVTPTITFTDDGSITPSGALPAADSTRMIAATHYYDVELQWSAGATIYTPISSTFILTADITTSTP